MADRDFEQVCPDGTTLKIAVSVLIKELRRGKELEATYWARQIEGGGYWKYLFRRLSIFATEDVGLGNPLAIAVVEACKSAYAAAKTDSKGTPEGDLIVHAVRVLALSEKNRENDDLKNVEHHLRAVGWKPEIPEYAIDWHTPQGRELYEKDASMVLWLTEWSKVVPDTGWCDWRLWQLRVAALEGLLDSDEVERLGQEWEEAGRLRYGMVGVIGPSRRKGH